MAQKFSFSLNDEELKIWTAFAEYRGLSLDYLVETVVPKLYTRFMLLIMTNPDEVDMATEAGNNALSEGVRENLLSFLEGIYDQGAGPV